MKSKDVKVGQRYLLKDTSGPIEVKIESVLEKGYVASIVGTKKRIRLKSATKLSPFPIGKTLNLFDQEPEVETEPTVVVAPTPPRKTEAKPVKSGLASLIAKESSKVYPPHLIVKALAGTGKTTTMIEGLKWMKGIQSNHPAYTKPSDQQLEIYRRLALSRDANSIAMVAYNRSIAQELKERVPFGVEAMTVHSMGNRAITSALGPLKLEENRTKNFICQILGVNIWEARKKHKEVLSNVESLVGYCKQYLFDGTQEEDLDKLVMRFQLEITDNLRDKTFELVQQVLELSQSKINDMDYDDMVWLPLVLNLPMKKYDMLITDECVPGWTPVMLADGSSKTIKEIVESEEEISVRAYDTTRGIGRNCKVIGRQKILNQKPLLKIKVRKHKREDSPDGHKRTNFVICTVDHKLWTINRGWVAAQDIVVGDDVIVETAALTTTKGKITSKGRDTLAKAHIGNKKGFGKIKHGTAEQFNKIKGGNGRGPTLGEKTVFEALNKTWGDNSWIAQYAVKTMKSPQFRKGMHPYVYKIDVAHPELKIGIEVDGNSHGKNKEKDDKKTSLLKSLGWTIIRVSNRQAVQQIGDLLIECLELERSFTVCPGGIHCPRPAEVVSIEPMNINDNYVYDITVEHCHNFYANGILVHNCQDLNLSRQALIKKCGQRIILIGDEHQAIYGFAGADSEAMDRMERELKSTKQGCDVLKLTETRRCGKKIVEAVKYLVPDFKAASTNPEGKISHSKYPGPRGRDENGYFIEDKDSYLPLVKSGDMILCRNNAPLIRQCFKLLKMNIPAKIQGREIGTGLIKLCEKLNSNSVTDFIRDLGVWYSSEMAKEMAKPHPSDSVLDSLQDRYGCLMCFTEGLGATSPAEMVQVKIRELFTDETDRSRVLLSSIHKAKGMESKRVFFIKTEMCQLPHPRDEGWQLVQSENLLYVGITRAIEELVWVN